jgi:proteasome accessory factor C
MTDPIPRLRRLLTMIPLIRRSQGITIDELSRLMKVSRKEINSDLQRLALCGVPPYLPHDYITVLYDGDKISIDYADQFEKPAALTLREALALKLALEALPPGGHALKRARDELVLALDRLLREQGTELSAELEGRLDAATSDATAEKLDRVRGAVKKRKPIVIDYYSASSEKDSRRTVRPLGVAEAEGNHYLVALDESKNDVRHFRIDRISRIEEPKNAARFDPPADFDLSAFMKKGFGVRAGQPIKLRFGKAVARFAREEYDGFPIESLPSGEIVVEIQAGSVTWAVSRALGYGEHARVLGPPEARGELKKRLEEFLARGATGPHAARG